MAAQMPQGPKANKVIIAFIVSLSLMRLILGFVFFDKISLPGANLTVLPILLIALIFPDKCNTRTFGKTFPFAAWALLAYLYSYILGARSVSTLLEYIDIIGAMYLLIFFFEFCLSKAEHKVFRIDPHRWIWILLAINTCGYILSDGNQKYQLFSSQIVPIAAVSLQSTLFNNDRGTSVLRRYFLGGSSLVLLGISEARAALAASVFVFACGCIYQVYLRLLVPRELDSICKTIGSLALPRTAKGIMTGIAGCYIVYFSFLFWLNTSYLPSIGLSYGTLPGYIGKIEICNYARSGSESLSSADELLCNSLSAAPSIQRDVSVVVRVASDLVFAGNAITRPIDLLLPKVSTVERSQGPNYLNRSHNLIFHLTTSMGIPSAFLLLDVLWQNIRRAEAITMISPALFPVIVLSLFTINDINYSIPFLMF